MLFAKDGLPFNPGVAFDLTVAREWIGKLGIGSQGGPTANMVVPYPLTLLVGPQRACCGFGKSGWAGMARCALSL